ncbi:hypothetical protein L6164_015306 [Bauhinia variegata]|uniref:Uncharacterized protein n=1 Tax=Bauhinia variegata TaxID=167791 RepID=A0ACB9NNW4_BAUVA|nr:hypothetical protein L6164_015306 [Bauhinia variegata]
MISFSLSAEVSTADRVDDEDDLLIRQVETDADVTSSTQNTISSPSTASLNSPMLLRSSSAIFLGIEHIRLTEGANKAPILTTTNLPQDFDWRDHGAVTSIKDQINNLRSDR